MPVLFGGVGSPVAASETLVRYMSEGWAERHQGLLEFIESPEDIVTRTLDIIDGARAALKIDVPQERVLFDMEMRRELSV